MHFFSLPYLRAESANLTMPETKVYPYPNDEQELDRLDMQHHIWKKVNEDRLFLAPLTNPTRILDIGTGSGIWPIEMGMITHRLWRLMRETPTRKMYLL